MRISRRKLLQGSALASASLAIPRPFHRALLGPGGAHASSSIIPTLVTVQLEGGNDGLNTVTPIDDVAGHPQRSAYEAARPTIGIPTAQLAATTIGPDPVKGNTLALHPAMTELKNLFDSGNLAVIQGVAYPNQSLSHFSSEDFWFSAEPNQIFNDGWLGRYLNQYYGASEMVAANIDGKLSDLFSCSGGCNVLSVKKLSEFELPQDPLYPDPVASRIALEEAFLHASDPNLVSTLQNAIGKSGDVLFEKLDEYDAISTNWSSNLNGVAGSLAKRLKEVSSIIRHDAKYPGAAVGARYFHVRLGGFDTHSNQATRHDSLLTQLSQALGAFYQDLQDINIESGTQVSEQVLALTISEFGRRIAENGAAGTDHGKGSVLFALGDKVNGGIYGEMPAIDAPDGRGNLEFTTDFRQVYATIIDRWLRNPDDHIPLIPGGPWPLLPFLS